MSSLYVTEAGSFIKRDGGHVVVGRNNEVLFEVPLERIEDITVFDSVSITSSLVTDFIERGVPITWLSGYGKYFGTLINTNTIDINKHKKQFDLLDEVRKSALSALKVMLPDEEIIGDPFWVIMETEQDSDKNTGNYEMVNDSILLFLSKKQAINYCSKIKKSAKVFGISQNHLKVLVSLQEKGMFPDFSIAFPEFEQLQENSILCYQIPHKSLKKFYMRGDNNE
jgi:hypothetical protein